MLHFNYRSGTTKQSTSGPEDTTQLVIVLQLNLYLTTKHGQHHLPHPSPYPRIVIAFESPACSSTFSVDEKGVFPFVEGINARTYDFPFTVTVAYRCFVSPFSYLT